MDTIELLAQIDILKGQLQKYKEIEEELGISLETLFKALRQFYAKDLDCYCPRPVILFQDCYDEWRLEWCSHYYLIKDYGKTWALTKEELENGK